MTRKQKSKIEMGTKPRWLPSEMPKSWTQDNKKKQMSKEACRKKSYDD